MMREGTSEATTKKVRTNRRLPLCRWQAQTLRLTWNRKRILRGKCAGGEILPWPELSPPRPPPRATSSNESLEYILARRLRHRRLTARAQIQDESPVRIATTVRIGSLADDRPTPPFL